MNGKIEQKRLLGAVLYRDFEVLDLYGPIEMFGNVGPELQIVTVAESSEPVRSAQGPKTVADFGFDECPALQLVLIPGGIGTQKQLSNTKMLNFFDNLFQNVKIPKKGGKNFIFK